MTTPLSQFLTRSLLHLAVIAFVIEQFLFLYTSSSQAADLPITPDGSTNTQISKTASGIDQVNIATPNNNGTSRNHFSDYNVNPSGQILNNFSGAAAAAINGTGAVIQTQIGGLVATNPNLINSGSANLIIVEVTSNNVSKLLGYTEIAGSKAGLILANPNGITCAGCGFINTSRLLMVAGSSNFDANGNLGFNLKEPNTPDLAVPLISIEGLGLDVERLSAADIVALAVKVIGNIYGGDNTILSLKSGSGRYDYVTKNILQNVANDHLEPFSPLFAIDVSSLTKIQSGQIFLIATKEGFGVNMAGEILAKNQVNIDANGDIYYAKIAAENEVALKSTKSIQSIDNAAKIAAPNVTITANQFAHLGSLIAQDLTIQNSNKLTNFGEITVLNLNLLNITNIENHNLLYGEDSFKISANFISNYGAISAKKMLNFDANLLDNFGIIESADNTTFNLKKLDNHEDALINSQNNLNFIVQNELKNAGEISALKNLKIDGTATLENFHKIIADSTLEIFGNSLKNHSSAILASLNANIIITLSNDLENDGEIFSKNDLTLTLNNALNNSGKISSLANFNVTANASFTNNNEISAAENLTITSNNLTNNKTIAAAEIVTITATNNITNNSTLQSGKNFTLTATNLINSAASLIISGQNLTITANSITNSNTKSANKTLSSGLISSAGLISLNTNSLNNDSGIIASKSTALTSLNNNGDVILSNISGSFIATTAITLDLGHLDHVINGEINAENIDITANNITNLGKVTAATFIKLNATGADNINGSGNIVNGYVNSDALNKNVVLAAGSYINLSAKNNINNYGNILATTNLTLTSFQGNINNYAGTAENLSGKIQGGSGVLTINAVNGAFNNYNKSAANNPNLISSAALFSSDNDTLINVLNLNNNGEISVKNNLTANVTNNLSNNSSALIWSDKDLTLNVANTLLNDRATIYSNRHLIIQKNAAGEKTNLVQNISGNIETFGIYNAETATIEGDLTIKAVTLENKRNVDPGVWLIKPDRNGKPYFYVWNDGKYDLKFVNDSLYNWQFVRDRCFGSYCREYQAQFRAAAPLNAGSIAANIISGANIVLESTSILNDTSNILSSQNLTINASNLLNKSKLYPEILYMKTNNGQHNEYTDNAAYFPNVFSAIALDNDAYFGSFIKAGKSFYGSGFATLRNITISPNYVYNSSTKFNESNSSNSQVISNSKIDGSLQISKSTIVNGIDVYNLSETGAINLDLSQIAQTLASNYAANNSQIGTIFTGEFKINLSKNPNQPLLEGRSQFIDATKFFGSDYFFTLMGIDRNALLRNIEQQTKQATNSIRMLGDAFVETKLILDQIRTITNDSLLLSAATTNANDQIKALLDNSAIELAKLGLSASDVAVNGLSADQANALTSDIITFEKVTVGENMVLAPKIYLSLASRNKLLNADNALAKNAVIFAQKDLVIDAPNANLFNSGSIIAGNDLTLNLAALTNQSITTTSQIKSNADLTITAHNGDIKNIGSDIAALGTLNLESLQGNILNSAIVQTNAANLLAANGDSYQDAFGDGKSSGNITSNLVSTATIKGGEVNITAAQDFTNLAAAITTAKNNLADNSTTSGDLTIQAGDDVNINALQLRNRSEERWGNSKKGGSKVTDLTKNIGSDLTSANAVIIIANASGADSESSGKLQGANVQISGSNISATDNITLAAANNVNVEATQDLSYQESQSWKKGLTTTKFSVSGSQSINNNLATLSSENGDVVIASGDSTNLIGAKVKADDVTIDAGAEINIYSVLDQNKSWSSSSKSRDFSKVVGGDIMTSILPLSPSVILLSSVDLDLRNRSQSSSQNTSKTANIASVIEAKNNVALTSNSDVTISGSNISGKSGQITSTQGDVNIIAAIETENSHSSSNSSHRESNLPGFNGSNHSASDTTQIVRNIGSNLTFTDSLEINAGNPQLIDQNKGNIHIKGSTIIVSNGDLALNAANKITIENAIDSSFKESSSNKKNETMKSFSNAVDYIERSVAARINANNITMQSGGDTVIQGSDINSKNNLMIGSFTIAQNSDGSYQKDGNGNYVTISGATVDNLIIKDAEVQQYHYAQNGNGYSGIAAVAMRTLPYLFAPIQIANDLVKKEMAILFPDAFEQFYLQYHPLGWGITAIDKVGDKIGAIKISTTNETRSENTTSYASNINVGGSMMTNSIGDTTIQGSNINIAGDLLANAWGSFNVQAATNSASTFSQNSYENAGTFHSNLNLTHTNYQAGISKDFVTQGSTSHSTTLVSSNLNIGGSALINSADQFNLLASNLISAGTIEIATNNNLNISDAKQTQSTSSYLDKLTIDTGVQAGNAYVDAAYAVVDAYKAQKAVTDAYKKLEKIEHLHNQGLASSKAVARAQEQVVLALINAGLSYTAAMQAVGNAGKSAATSGGTGFYGSLYANITKLKSTTTSEYAQSIASNLQAGSDVSLTSGTGDINISGSNVSATNGNLNLTAMLGNINISAGESSASQESKSSSKSLGGSAGSNGLSANIGFSQSDSSSDYTTYTNSTLTAQNGSLNINSGQDATIFGANLLAQDVNLHVGGNLLLKSRQNLLESDSYSIGASLGLSSTTGNSVNGANVGFNTANSYQSRAWVDQITSIIGTNSVKINTAKNTDIVGAIVANITNYQSALTSATEGYSQLIDGGNLTLNTGSLSFSDLKNYNNSESNSLKLGFSIGFKANAPSAPQNSQSTQDQKGVVPGNLNINLSMQGSESSSSTKATIGRGTINISGIATTDSQTSGLNRNITATEQNQKTTIINDFKTNLNIDTRLLVAGTASLASWVDINGADKIATNNWDSYKIDTVRGEKIFGYSLYIPALSLSALVTKEDLTVRDALYATAKNYNILYNLAYNPNIKASDLAGMGTLISYDGEDVKDNINSKYANGFYDRENDIVSVNISENDTNSKLAGTLAHEGVHRDMNMSGRSYDFINPANLSSYNSEEIAAHLVGDFAESTWGSFQSNNISLIASLPTVTLQSNNYANNVNFNSPDINPYQKDVHKYLTRYLAENAGFTPEEARQIAEGNYKVDLAWNKQPLTADWMMALIRQGHPKEDYHFTTPERREKMKNIAYETGNFKLFGEYLHAVQDSYSHQRDGVTYDTGIGHIEMNLRTWDDDIHYEEISSAQVYNYLGFEIPSESYRKEILGGLIVIKGNPSSSLSLPVFQNFVNDKVGDMGAYTDWTFARPELADDMAKSTFIELKKFFQYKNPSVPDDWQEIINENNQITPTQNYNNFDKISNNVRRFNRSAIDDPEKKSKTLYE